MILLVISTFIKGFLVFGATVLLLFLTYCAFYKSEISKEESAPQNTVMPVDTPAERESSDIPSVYIDECMLLNNSSVPNKKTPKKYKETANKHKEIVKYKVNNPEFVDEESSDIPSVYIDECMLPNNSTVPKKYKETANEHKEIVKYKVNDSEFVDEFIQDDCLVQFELRAKEVEKLKMEHDYDLYCSTPTDSESESEDDSEPLTVALQDLSHGVIVNSTIYLTVHQWNTLVFIDPKTMRCFVCDLCTDLDTCTEHVAKGSHASNLRDHPPLLNFDLSCIRKIGQNYHCAVCNEIFDIADNLDHFGSKTHEGNFLFAINKASDVLYDSNMHVKGKRETFNFKKETVIVDRNANDDAVPEDYSYQFINFQNHYEDFQDEIQLPQSGISYAKMAKTPKVNTQQFIDVDLGNKKVRVRFDSWHMVICPELNKFYCMVCKIFDHVRMKTEHCSKIEHLRRLESCQVVEAYEEYFIRQVDNKLYHCGHCNNLQLIHEMIDHVETVHPRKTKIIADSRHAKSPSPSKESIQGNGNTIAENKSTISKNRNTISENKDTSNENRNAINERNTNVSRNLLKDSKNHAGQPVIKPHLVQKFNVQNNNTNISRNTDNDTIGFTNNGAMQSTVQNTNNGNFDSKMADLFEYATLYLFGHSLTIPILSYNIVCKRPTDFYCGICDFICPEELIMRHIYEIRHIEMMQRTPFIVPFSYHLIRAIREALHCAICNMPVTADKIYHHIREPQHLNFLTNALKITEPNPLQVPNVPTFNISQNFNKNAENIINNAEQNTIQNNNNTFNTANKAPKEVSDVKINLETGMNSPLKKAKINLATENHVKNKNTRNVEVYEENLDATFDSVASEDASFDLEEYVYLKLRNTYIKIANLSYNTLVHIGDGSRYCFVCAVQVEFCLLQRHVESRGHLENIEKYRFLDKYEDHLLRQIYLMYHCSICNVLITRKELKTHLEWPTHILQNENTSKIIKKQRKTEIKGGIKQIVVSTQKENIYLNDKETKIKIGLNVIVTNNTEPKINRKNKIIILDENVFKVSWESWHGVSRIKNGYKCNLCQRELGTSEIETHCESEWHMYGLEKPFEKQYGTALIRKINDSTLNCLVCNTEVSNKEHIIKEHIYGKKHAKNYETILKDSSVSNTYTDCDENVFTV